ncbi:MAG: hypothetical protein LKI72_08025 [Prevotella sp.]|nr:hypothetical protein [Prevotella sp.]MCI1686060.1 hypothetical protein [Prevotella sp.]MCI1781493.1 hypothetical protein [Prevotella sp.]MCI1817117.1 hypothetical protein [Prevotella sp.]
MDFLQIVFPCPSSKIHVCCVIHFYTVGEKLCGPLPVIVAPPYGTTLEL